MSKLPNPFGKPKTVTPKPTKATPEEGKAQQEAGMALQKFLAQKPPGVVKKTPVAAPPGGFKSGMGGQHYEGERGIDPTAMRAKMATKDKVLNPVKKAVGLGFLAKPAKMVPAKPPKQK